MKHRFLRPLALLLCLGLLLSGCTKDSPSGIAAGHNTFGSVPEEEAEASIAVAGTGSTNTFSMPINASYGWDPYACISMENRAVMQLIYEGLFTMNQSFDPEPVLCKEYDVSENGLMYTITLHEATFSDGRAMTAEDVLYSYEQARNSTVYGSRFRDVSQMVVSDLYSITIYMNSPNDRLPCMLDFPIIPNLSTTVSPLGTGPFVRESVSQLKKNENWWQGPSLISFDSVGLYSSLSAEDTRDHFEIDTIQFVYNDPIDTTAATYHCDYELWNSKGTVMQYLGFNMSAGVFQDSRLRSAVLKAIDRTEIAETVYHNYADAAILPVSPSSSMYFEDLARQYSYDRDTALDELMASGSFYLPDDHPVVTGAIFEDDFEIQESEPDSTLEDEYQDELDILEAELEDEEARETEITETTEPEENTDPGYNPITMLVMSGNLHRLEAAEKVAEYLSKVGFTVTLDEMEEDEFIFTLYNLPDEWDLYYIDAQLTPDFDLRTILYPGYSLNYGTVPEDETLRSLYYSALENSGNRYDLYEYIMEKAYICPILFQNNALFTTRGVFSGLNPSPDNLFYSITSITINN